MFKIGTRYGPDDVELRYGNVYQCQDYPQWSRTAIGADANQIPLMLEMAKSWPGPYGLLYVLVLSRRGHARARYQCPRPCGYNELESFAHQFRQYLEKDARHNLWIKDVGSPYYHAEFDDAEDQIINYWNWKPFPLEDTDNQ